MVNVCKKIGIAARTALLAGCVVGLNTPSLAQDSVSPTPGLPGDAPDAYAPGTQQLNFVVDLTPKTSSWGSAYELAPVLKASKSSAGGYFDLLIGAQGVSNRLLPSQFFASTGDYGRWTTPGQGATPGINTPPAENFNGSTRAGQRFAVAFHEFGSGTDGAFASGDDENNVVGALINVQTRTPNRLFVSRRYALQNKTASTAAGTASFGVGAVDELGNTHIYADNFGMTTPLRLAQRELTRVRLIDRSPAGVNALSNAGATDPAATTRVRITQTSMTVPNILPQNTPGGAGRPIVLASDFASNFIAETGAGTTTTAPFPGASPRGSLALIPQPFPPLAGGGAIATGASLVRTDSNSKTRAIQLFALLPSGALASGAQQLALPANSGALIDPTDNFAPGSTFAPISDHEFTNYASQASFRGGASQVALTILPGGDLLAAALVAATGGGSAVPQSEDNYLAVARVPAAGGTPTWTVAAHTGGPSGASGGTSKAILGRSTSGQLVTIGRIAKHTEVFGSASTGPSISSPAIDRAGNLYFMATMSLDTPTGGQNLTSGLLRANFNASTGAYQLELIATLGDVIAGANSARNYQIQFMGIADADSVDSGAIFSGAIVQEGLGANIAALPYASPLTFGALAFRAKIVYDYNADGVYADPSGAGGGSTSPDQAYNVVMVLMPRVTPGDFNRDGVRTVQDIFDFLAAWFAGSADYNGDGSTTVQDIFDFLNDWFQV